MCILKSLWPGITSSTTLVIGLDFDKSFSSYVVCVCLSFWPCLASTPCLTKQRLHFQWKKAVYFTFTRPVCQQWWQNHQSMEKKREIRHRRPYHLISMCKPCVLTQAHQFGLVKITFVLKVLSTALTHRCTSFLQHEILCNCFNLYIIFCACLLKSVSGVSSLK